MNSGLCTFCFFASIWFTSYTPTAILTFLWDGNYQFKQVLDNLNLEKGRAVSVLQLRRRTEFSNQCKEPAAGILGTLWNTLYVQRWARYLNSFWLYHFFKASYHAHPKSSRREQRWYLGYPDREDWAIQDAGCFSKTGEGDSSSSNQIFVPLVT